MTETTRDKIVQASAYLPPMTGLLPAAAAALGTTEADLNRVALLGVHPLSTDETAALYMITDRVFAIFEANRAGRTFTLTVPLDRIRRVARLDDATYTRLTIELDADRTVTVNQMDADGRSEGAIIPSGYEIVEAGDEPRSRLTSFQIALSQALTL